MTPAAAVTSTLDRCAWGVKVSVISARSLVIVISRAAEVEAVLGGSNVHGPARHAREIGGAQ